MTEKLKPCPFCGGEAEIIKDDMYVWGHCTNCDSDTDLYQIKKEAVAAWNARPIEDAQTAENKRLREALELIAKAKFYFARGEEEKQIRRVCEIAEDALKGCSE